MAPAPLLDPLIDSLEKQTPKSARSVRIAYMFEDEEFAVLQATRPGLAQLGLELMKLAREDVGTRDTPANTSLGDLFATTPGMEISSIAIVSDAEFSVLVRPQTDSPTWRSRLGRYVFISALAYMVGAAIVGTVVLGKLLMQ